MSFVIEQHDEKVDPRPSNEFFEHEAHICFKIVWPKFTATDRKRTRVDNAHLNSLAVVALFDQSPLHKLGRADCLEIENQISSTQLQRISTGLRGDIKGLKTSVVKNDVESNCDFKELLLDERGAGVDCAVVVLFYFK